MSTGGAEDGADAAVWVRPDGRSVRYYRLGELLPPKPAVAVVTGADTYVGRALAQALIGAGQPVAALASVPADLSAPSVLGRAGFHPAWEAMLAAHDASVIFHCTRRPFPPGGTLPARREAALAWETHVADTLEMLRRWERDDDAPPVVLLSSAAVYGAYDPHPVSERTALHPDSAWAESLAAAEALVAKVAPRHAILRVFEVVGPDDRGRVADSRAHPWTRLAAGFVEPLPAMWDCVALDEVVAALMRAGRHLAGGGPSLVLNVGSGIAASPGKLADAFGLPAPPPQPARGLVADMACMQATWGWAPAAPNLGALARASRRAVQGRPAEAPHD